VFAQPIGNDTIDNFNVGSDTIDLIGFGSSSFSDLQTNIANDASGNAVITLGNGETITIMGVNSAGLSASNFVFNQEPATGNAGTITIGDGAILPLGGTVTNTGTIAISSVGAESDLEILIRGATLQGGGQVVLSDNSQNVVFGSDAAAVLDNVDNVISGAGQIGSGQLTLTNEGVIDATGNNALVIDTGTNAIINRGMLEASGAGGLVVNSAVTGGGTAEISGSGGIEFGRSSDTAVVFDEGATGTLRLDQSAAFTGTIAGLGGGNALDLGDIAAGANATLGFAANASGSGGTLTVSDGAHTASLALLGQYAAAGFTSAGDASGGTIITYAPPQGSTTDPMLLSNPPH